MFKYVFASFLHFLPGLDSSFRNILDILITSNSISSATDHTFTEFQGTCNNFFRVLFDIFLKGFFTNGRFKSTPRTDCATNCQNGMFQKCIAAKFYSLSSSMKSAIPKTSFGRFFRSLFRSFFSSFFCCRFCGCFCCLFSGSLRSRFSAFFDGCFHSRFTQRRSSILCYNFTRLLRGSFRHLAKSPDSQLTC